jgi:regulator of cell morphogenesis and NO signaling
MAVIDTGATMADIVIARPERASVFETLRIDYCCNGRLALAETCRENGLDVSAVLAALAECDSQPAAEHPEDWTIAPLFALCNHIVAVHHHYLRSELPRVSRLADSTARAHGAADRRLVALRFVLGSFRSTLDVHLNREEQIAFPAIARLEMRDSPGDASIDALLRGLENEHRHVDAVLRQIRLMTGDVDEHAVRSPDHGALLAGLRRLESDLHQHIHKENNILFERVRMLVFDGTRVG